MYQLCRRTMVARVFATRSELSFSNFPAISLSSHGRDIERRARKCVAKLSAPQESTQGKLDGTFIHIM